MAPAGLLLLWFGAALVGAVVWHRARHGAFTLAGDLPPRRPIDLLALTTGLVAAGAGLVLLILAGVS